ncbi:MAG TPA: MucR family transcriptional regulator [Caulobacteraceae bacterium]|jgi:predicted transcriptional regulator
MADNNLLIEMTAEIVAAFVGNNSVPPGDIPGLISQTYAALSGAETPPVVEPEVKTPAVSVKRSIQPDFIICLEDGRKFKSLKRHLRTKYNLSPEDYRAKWGLPKDYPMVAPNYAAARSTLAKQMGLGQGGRGGAPAPAAKAKPAAKVAAKPAAKAAPATRGRKPKAG